MAFLLEPLEVVEVTILAEPYIKDTVESFMGRLLVKNYSEYSSGYEQSCVLGIHINMGVQMAIWSRMFTKSFVLTKIHFCHILG